jgi:hypothetical protein
MMKIMLGCFSAAFAGAVIQASATANSIAQKQNVFIDDDFMLASFNFLPWVLGFQPSSSVERKAV